MGIRVYISYEFLFYFRVMGVIMMVIFFIVMKGNGELFIIYIDGI